MPVNCVSVPEAPPTAGEKKCLKFNIVIPVVGDSAEGSASFGRLLLDLAALAFDRFDAARAKDGQDVARPGLHNPGPQRPDRPAPRESAPAWLAGHAGDPFDGQLLRFRKAEGGYEIQSVGSGATVALRGD